MKQNKVMSRSFLRNPTRDIGKNQTGFVKKYNITERKEKIKLFKQLYEWISDAS
jgi:hypothetical protein